MAISWFFRRRLDVVVSSENFPDASVRGCGVSSGCDDYDSDDDGYDSYDNGESESQSVPPSNIKWTAAETTDKVGKRTAGC